MTTPQLYRNLIKDTDHPFCWACGRSGDYYDKPADWWAEWWVDRAHIVSRPRVEDRRLVVLLCRLCHLAFACQRIVTASRPLHWPALTRANLVWLKMKFDPDYYDRAFLEAYCSGKLPRAAKPPYCYLAEYRARHPL